jgi:hypothetical protein
VHISDLPALSPACHPVVIDLIPLRLLHHPRMHFFQPPGPVGLYVVPSLRATVWAMLCLEQAGYEMAPTNITVAAA